MTETARELARVRNPVLVLSAAAWIVMIAGSASGSLAHCAVTRSGPSRDSLAMLLDMNPPSALLAGWLVMLVAMMAPTLIEPIRHVLDRNFRSRRFRSLALFAAGYTAVWTAAGVATIAVQLAVSLLAPGSLIPATLALLVAAVWQCSPFKQVCLNRNHNHSELRAFGLGADADALKFGLNHGVWCVGSCWALMLFPMLLPTPTAHNLAMAIATFIMVGERMDRPRPPAWRVRGPGGLVRFLLARARASLQASGPRTAPSLATAHRAGEPV